MKIKKFGRDLLVTTLKKIVICYYSLILLIRSCIGIEKLNDKIIKENFQTYKYVSSNAPINRFVLFPLNSSSNI